MTRLVLLHSNDVHGNVEGLARIATLVERERAARDCPVLYVDAGDVEDTTTRISNLTKGAAMHRVLAAAGCDAAAAGNAGWLSYGPQVLADHAAEASYPILLANLRSADGSAIPGTRDSALVDAGGVRVGLIGVSSAVFEHELPAFGMTRVEEGPLVRELAASLRAQGAELVVVLSHLGLDQPDEPMGDLRLAADVQGAVDLIVGAHSHHLLPEGERVGSVLVVQAGDHATHLGRVEVDGSELRASVEPVGAEVPAHPAVLAAASSVEPEIEALLGEVVGELPERLDEDAATRWLAGVLRDRMGADVGLVSPGVAFTGPLPAGPLSRGALWEVCESRANPGVVTMTGEQLRAVIERGRDPEFAGSTARALRGRPRGVLQVSGANGIEPGREYRVAATDWELERYGGLVDPDWGLRPRYDFPTIVREAVEEALA